MKVKFPEPIGPEVLYECFLEFQNLSINELKDLLGGLETALDIVCNRLNKNEFSIIEYELIFYRGRLKDNDFIGNDFMGGGMNLSANPKRITNRISGFQKEYKDLFKKVKKDYEENPSPLSLNALLVGYRDSITHEIEAKDPF